MLKCEHAELLVQVADPPREHMEAQQLPLEHFQVIRLQAELLVQVIVPPQEHVEAQQLPFDHYDYWIEQVFYDLQQQKNNLRLL